MKSLLIIIQKFARAGPPFVLLALSGFAHAGAGGETIVALSDDFAAPEPLVPYTVASPLGSGQAAMSVFPANQQLVFRWIGGFGVASATHGNSYPLPGSCLEADVSFVTAGNPRSACGIEWYANPDDRIQLSLQQDDNDLNLSTTIGGVYHRTTVPLTVDTNVTYRLVLEIVSPVQIRAYVDGNLLIDLPVDLSGAPALFQPSMTVNSKAEADLVFDDLLVRRPAFSPSASQQAGVNPFHLAIADYNGDQIPDVAVVNSGIWPSGSGTLSVLLGNGDGTLMPQDSYPLGTTPQCLVIGDFNNDGWPDLAAANRHPLNPPGTISIYLNSADGSGDFTLASTVSASNHLINIALGFFNNDAFLDIAVGVHISNAKIEILLGNGDGTFDNTLPGIPVPSNVNGIAVAQLNPSTDSHADIVVSNWLGGSSTTSILLGDGTGAFSVTTSYPISERSWSVQLADMNEDGHQDIVVPSITVGPTPSNNVLAIFPGNGDGTFRAATVTSLGLPSYLFDLADTTHDGHLDFVTVDGSSIRIFPSNGDGTLQAPGQTFTPQAAGYTTTPDVALADMNGDGLPDLVVTQQAPSNGLGAVAVLLQAAVEPPVVLTQSTINPAKSFAYAANAGWLDLRPSLSAGVVISESFFAGNAYAANFGWVHLGDGSPANGHNYANDSAEDYGVNLSPDGDLTGWAYSGNVGWISFEQTYGQPRLDFLTGSFSGFCHGSNIGWIALDTPYSDLATQSIAYPDTDLDGIGDSYERLHFGNLTTANASSDTDGDGRSDRDEYASNSDAGDPLDWFRILDFIHLPGIPTESTLTFTSAPERVLTIEHDTDLQGVWTPSALGAFLSDSGPTTTRKFQHPDPARSFFRVTAKRPLEP